MLHRKLMKISGLAATAAVASSAVALLTAAAPASAEPCAHVRGDRDHGPNVAIRAGLEVIATSVGATTARIRLARTEADPINDRTIVSGVRTGVSLTTLMVRASTC